MTTTRLSSKGQLVIPTEVRRVLRLRAGDRLSVSVHDGRIVLERVRQQPARLVRVGGRKLLMAPADAPAMTSAEVRQILADFP